MWTLFKSELKNGRKQTLIWSVLVGGLGLICLLLYKSMEGSMLVIADSFASMGAFADAFGMSTLSIGTVGGYFATEIGTIHGLGSGMFAACLATPLLSKEEEAHTADFTYTLPVSRQRVLHAKALYMVCSLLLFTFVCFLFYLAGFLLLGEAVPYPELIHFMCAQLLMDLVIAGICYVISACTRKTKLGIGIGIAMFFYAYDLMSRILPALRKYKLFSPYSFANATDIFAHKKIPTAGISLGIFVILLSFLFSQILYIRKDLSC
ncbi:MAG: ABC transporter permease subunit [Eubacteriales bacterium]|nr:ABC transporter permease subunit [Eubacteriales bacterium]